MTAYFTHDDFSLHAGEAIYPGHPERPQRLAAIEQGLRQAGLWPRLAYTPFEAAADDHLLLCHTPEHLQAIRDFVAAGGGHIEPSTYVVEASDAVARLAAGAARAAVDTVMTGAAPNAFVAARPPGHHAESHRPMGFCLYNNIACAARYAQRQYGLQRVAILDWDVHHGNGTQQIFYDDPTVLFVSVHQSPWYPYFSGARNETGRGAGIGATVNYPLPSGSGDEEYGHVWDEVGEHVDMFRPELILISAGFDAHHRDPLGGMEVTGAGFARLMRQSLGWAREHCAGRVVAVLEGGYDLRGLSESAVAVVGELLGTAGVNT